MIVNKNNYPILEKASKITCTNYDIKWFNKDEIDGYIDIESLVYIIEDLINEIDRLQETKENKDLL